MKKNLFLILLSLLTVTWSMGQKAPEKEKEQYRDIDVTATIDLSDFMTKQSVKSSSLRGPLNEGFEDETFPPPGWKVINDGDTYGWVRSTTNPIMEPPVQGFNTAQQHTMTG